MRVIPFVFFGLLAASALAEKPRDVRIDTLGTFDANRVLIATFTASGAINELGSVLDTPRFVGQAVNVSRLLTTAHGDYISIAINLTHIAGLHRSPPDWCAPPPSPEGTLLFSQPGNWRVVSGTGPYSMLAGGGSFEAWIVFDAASFTPLAAKECLIGGVVDVPGN